MFFMDKQSYIGGLHNIYSFFYIAAGIASLPFCSLILWEGLKKIRLTYFFITIRPEILCEKPRKGLGLEKCALSEWTWWR